MFHQEWEPIVIKKPKPPVVFENKVRVEEKKIKVYSKELSDAVMSGRLTLRISQSELAKRCNVVPGVIQEIESRKGIYSAEIINKVLKVLKIQNVTRRFVEH